MQFHVPQFIEVENKIFGPLTFKQFIYLIGGAGFVFLLYAQLPFIFAVFFGLPVAAFSLALAFLKIQGRPFIKVAENALKHFMGTRLYLWKKPSAKIKKGIKKNYKEQEYMPRLTEGKLRELSWNLDVKEKIK